MPERSNQPETDCCQDDCDSAGSIEALNRSCYCLSLDDELFRHTLEADLGVRGLSTSMAATHPHLFASLPLFVSRAHIEAMAEVIRTVESVVSTPQFQRAALAWAPDIARLDPGSPGGLLGFDFHLAASGPKLIEINTNPGGALMNAVLARSHRSCCAEVATLAMAPMEPDATEEALFEVFMTEWRMQRPGDSLRTIAIVDEAPKDQYLYPEFLLYRQLFGRHGIDAMICAPGALDPKDGRLWKDGQCVDLIYNRLTDFALEDPAQAAIRLAYLRREVAISPHPRAHAIYADKRNLSLLCDDGFLREAGIDEERIATLVAAIPHTEIVMPANRDPLWAKRRELFFKPAGGYGSKAAYRGDKLTKRVWEEINQGIYVAQAMVTPSERHLSGSPDSRPLKADARNYAYQSVVRLVAARLYQGQTTNFRTPGGGFAPVFTERARS